MVFVDAGVLQLLPGQNGGTNGPKNIGNMIPALPLYEVRQVYVHSDSASRFGVDAGCVPENCSKTWPAHC